jgi:hypothetical protein
MLDFSLPTSGYVERCRQEFRGVGDNENMGTSVGISPLSSLQAEIWLFPVVISGLAAAMLVSHFRFRCGMSPVVSLSRGTTKIWV